MNYDYAFHPFKIEGGVVRRSGYRVEGADAATFKPLNSLWGVDASKVFTGTWVERGANPKTFQVLNELYAKDRKIYYLGGALKTADPETFRVLDKGFYIS